MRLGIIGNGFVGKATSLLECDKNKILIYDICPELCKGTSKIEDLMICDVIFICVPTPMNTDGSCHTKILKDIVDKLNLDMDIMVSRCTCPIGTSKRMKISYMPEFLTEKNLEYDFLNCENWIIGTDSDKLQKKMTTIINNAYNAGKIKYNNITFTTTEEAEGIKLFRNCFLATKIGFCNEFAEFCHHKGVDYENIRKIASEDVRIGQSHTRVPGPDGMYGFGGICLPKDINSVLFEMNKIDMNSYILQSVVERNEKVDRSQKDWYENIGRSVI